MSTIRFTLIFGLIFGVIAFGSADEFEDFFNDQELPLVNDGLEININRLLDDNIETIQDISKRFDPSKLPDIPLASIGQLTNGWLSKISTITRTGDSFLKYSDKTISLDLRMGWDILKYDFDYAFKLWFIQRRGMVHGSLGTLSINLKMYIDLRNYVIALEQFKIEKIGKLGLELEGTSIGDKLGSFIARIIINLGKDSIIDVLEDITSKIIQGKINEFNHRVANDKHQFTFVDIVKLNRDRYVIVDDYTEENY